MNIMITGAGRGIGLELVKHFSQYQNTHIYAVTRKPADLRSLIDNCNMPGSAIHPVPFKTSDINNNHAFLDESIMKNIPHLDILINNAAAMLNKPFEDIQLNEIQEILNLNFVFPAMLIKQLLPVMGKKGNTHVVNIGSMGGFQGSVKFRGLSIYSASKAALACLTECLQEEYKNRPVVFNCLALGAVQTEMLQEAFPGYKATLNPAEMAGFISEFALKAHHYIKGKVIPVSLTTP